MPTKPLLASCLLATLTTVSISVRAADTSQSTKTKPATTENAEQAPAKKVKPHSHLEEKLGVVPKRSEAKKETKEIQDETPRHSHPKDVK